MIVGDFADHGLLEESMRRHGIEAVVHFAALTYVGGSLSLLDAMRRAGVRRIVFSSTATVYGQPETVPIVEEVPLGPVNPYGPGRSSRSSGC